MPFFQMDDTFHSELRVIQAGTAAFGLYARCGDWVAEHLTDGFVPAEIAAHFGTREWIERLLASGLWLPADGGYTMPDYLGRHKNWSAERIKAQRAAVAERQARARSRRRQSPNPVSQSESPPQSRVTHSVSHGVSSRSPSHPPLKGDGGGAAPLSGGAAPPPQDHAPVPRDSPPVCALHHEPHPCRRCIAEGAAAAAAHHPAPRPQPATTAKARADPPTPAAAPDPAYDHAQAVLRRIPLGDLDPLLTEARADLDADGNPNPTSREITLRAADIWTRQDPQPDPQGPER